MILSQIQGNPTLRSIMDDDQLPEETPEYWEKKYNTLCRAALIGTYLFTCVSLGIGSYVGRKEAEKEFKKNFESQKKARIDNPELARKSMKF